MQLCLFRATCSLQECSIAKSHSCDWGSENFLSKKGEQAVFPPSLQGLPEEGPGASSTAIAFDGMVVPLAALPLLPALRPAVEYVLAAEEEGAGEEEEGQAGGEGAAAPPAASL